MAEEQITPNESEKIPKRKTRAELRVENQLKLLQQGRMQISPIHPEGNRASRRNHQGLKMNNRGNPIGMGKSFRNKKGEVVLRLGKGSHYVSLCSYKDELGKIYTAHFELKKRGWFQPKPAPKMKKAKKAQ